MVQISQKKGKQHVGQEAIKKREGECGNKREGRESERLKEMVHLEQGAK